MIDIKKSDRILIVLAIGTLALSLMGICLSRLIYPYDVGYYEACVWEPALLAANGMNPFNHAMQPPFVMAPYGYLYYLTIGLGLKLFGMQLWTGRLISILAVPIIVICIWRISIAIAQQRQAASLAVVVFLSSITLQSWIAAQRPDLPGLALAFTGLALVFGATDKSNRIGFRSILIAFLFSAAFFFKQTFILPVIVAFLWYIRINRRSQAFFVLTATIFLCALAIVILNRSPQRGYLWQHFILTRSIPYSYASSFQMLFGLLKSPALWVLSLIMALFLFNILSTTKLNIAAGQTDKLLEHTAPSRNLKIAKIFKSPGFLLLCYLVVAAALAFITSARTGANINYYFESSIVISILCSFVWARLSLNERFRVVFPLLILLLTLAGLFQMFRVGRGEYYRWQSLPYYNEIVAELGRLTQPKTVSVSVYPELAAAANRDYHFGDWIQYIDGRSTELRNVFQEAIASNNYPAIIWFDKDTNNLFPGYTLAPISKSPPERFYPVYLFIRNSIPTAR